MTPSSYLELLSSFERLIGIKLVEMMDRKARYDAGLCKIDHAESQILKLKEELEKLQPQLAVTKASTEEMIEVRLLIDLHFAFQRHALINLHV